MAFDTLRLAEKWEAAGAPSPQARGMVNALSEEMKEGLATKEFVRAGLAACAIRCWEHTLPRSSPLLC